MSPRICLFAFLALALACGGAQEPEPAELSGEGAEAKPAPKPATAEERNAAKLRAAQDVGCEGMCERTTRCAVEDARASMSAKELEELKLEDTAPRHQEECTTECKASNLSVRQVEVLHSCLREEASTCAELVTCLDQLKPQKS
ncbi:MAG: hypothetical protein KJO07_23085 [Deltaproteobacteria bacterium]|nr:hypothetical protein [Deltaproteobacteria bacterium]